jgi:predicted RNase H-like HicB family nuclease
MHEAIAFHIEGLRSEGLEVPEPKTRATYVTVAA